METVKNLFQQMIKTINDDSQRKIIRTSNQRFIFYSVGFLVYRSILFFGKSAYKRLCL